MHTNSLPLALILWAEAIGAKGKAVAVPVAGAILGRPYRGKAVKRVKVDEDALYKPSVRE